MTITPIYMPDGTKIYIADNGRNSEGRVNYIIRIHAADGRLLAEVDDLHSGVNAPVNHYEALASFSSFIGAWVEAIDYGNSNSENRDLFPMSLYDWASNNESELWMMTNEDDSEF